MALNTHRVIWRHKGESEETKSQDYIMNTDTCVQGACELTAFLTSSAEWNEANDDDERLSNTDFTVKEEELKYYVSLAQK